MQLEEVGVGWISALPWNKAPAELCSRAVEELPACSSAQPGVRAAAEKTLVHGGEYLCVVKYSASFAGEQLHSLTTSLSRVLQSLRGLAKELNKPKARWKQDRIERKIRRWLSAPFLAELIRYPPFSHRDRRDFECGSDLLAVRPVGRGQNNRRRGSKLESPNFPKKLSGCSADLFHRLVED